MQSSIQHPASFFSAHVVAQSMRVVPCAFWFGSLLPLLWIGYGEIDLLGYRFGSAFSFGFDFVLILLRPKLLMIAWISQFRSVCEAVMILWIRKWKWIDGNFFSSNVLVDLLSSVNKIGGDDSVLLMIVIIGWVWIEDDDESLLENFYVVFLRSWLLAFFISFFIYFIVLNN